MPRLFIAPEDVYGPPDAQGDFPALPESEQRERIVALLQAAGFDMQKPVSKARWADSMEYIQNDAQGFTGMQYRTERRPSWNRGVREQSLERPSERRASLAQELRLVLFPTNRLTAQPLDVPVRNRTRDTETSVATLSVLYPAQRKYRRILVREESSQCDA